MKLVCVAVLGNLLSEGFVYQIYKPFSSGSAMCLI